MALRAQTGPYFGDFGGRFVPESLVAALDELGEAYDLAKLDPGSIQTLLRNVEKDKLGLALKGATDGLRDVFFSNMSERAGKILRDDMEAMGPVRLKDVDEAQMRMVNIAKDLANKGEIMIASKQGEDELIY